MHAIVLDSFGGPEVLLWKQFETPAPGPGQILVRVKAAGINRADLSARSGQYAARPRRGGIYFYPFQSLPAVPGIEAAGIVEALGPDVEGVQVGDRVCGITGTGGYSEYCLMNDWLALPIPGGLSFADAASLPAAYLTVWIALRELSDIRRGDRVLIHAAGSAVGVSAIQFANHSGATVIGTAGSKEKLDLATALGMHHGINYREEDFAEVLANDPVDIVMDNVGGDTFARSLNVMAHQGRMVALSGAGGATATIPIGRFIGGHLRVMGMSMAVMLTPDRLRRFKREVMSLIPISLQPVVDSTFAIHDAPKAHQYVQENRNFGKVILEVP